MRRPWVAVAVALGSLLVLPLPASSPHAASPLPVPAQVQMPFSGYWWTVRNTGAPAEPGPNKYVATNAYLDASGAMHLKFTQDPFGYWGAAEIDSVSPMGYGTYTWTLGTPLDHFDPNLALGLFTRSPTATDSSHEIDMEVARWGRVREQQGAQFVVQPAGDPGHLVRVAAPASPGSVFTMVWSKARVEFTVTDAGRVIDHWVFRGSAVPSAADNHASMNLWTYGGFPPTDGATAEVIITKFGFCAQAATCS